MGSGTGYAINEVGCTTCGAGCDPLQVRCPYCGHDPLAGIGYQVGPLSASHLWRVVGLRLLLGVVLVGVFVGLEFVKFFWKRDLADVLSDLLVGICLALFVIVLLMPSVLRWAWQLWQLSRMRLILNDSGLILFYRQNGRVYLDRMGWSELSLPPAKSFFWLMKLLYGIGQLIGHWVPGLLLLLPDPMKELRLSSLWNRARVWTIPLSPALRNPTYTLTQLAAHALPYWLSRGLVRIEAGYEPSPDRPFLALDLSRGTLRAYAIREVLLDDAADGQPDSWSIGAALASSRPESTNPDGTRVEPDHSLEPERVSSEPQGAAPPPAFALPYGRYWLRADWDLIRQIESLRRASETASSGAATR